MNKAEILIIDDEPQIRKLLQINLESNDYKVVQARSGQEGLVLAASHPPDLILLDLNMPRMGGLEFLQELQAEPELTRAPVIVLTTSASDEDIISAYSLNANCYITKPADFTAFAEIIRTIATFWLSMARLPGV